MGSLYIEMAVLKPLQDLLKFHNWTEALAESQITIQLPNNTADSFLSASIVAKRTSSFDESLFAASMKNLVCVNLPDN